MKRTYSLPQILKSELREEYKKQDPIETTLDTILKKKYATQKEVDEITARIEKEIDDCVTFAENSPYPDDSELYKDIYAEPDYPS